MFSFVTKRSIRADRDPGARSAGSVHVNLGRTGESRGGSVYAALKYDDKVGRLDDVLV